MIPSDLPLLLTPGTAAVLPDGRTAVVSVVGPDLVTDEYAGQLWVVALDGTAPPRRLTHGHRDTSPSVSPDGRWVAFARAEPQGKPQLWVVEAVGGEPVRLTDEPLGVSAPVFGPDSARVAYLARVPEDGRLLAGGDPSAEPPRRITQLHVRADGLGYVADRRRHLFAVTVPEALGGPLDVAGVPRATLTAGDFDVDAPRWLPDGRHLVAVASVHAASDTDLLSDVVLVDAGPAADATGAALGAEPGPVRRLTAAGEGSDLAIESVLPSAEGDRLWIVASDMGGDGRSFVAALNGLYVLDLVAGADGPEADGRPRRLTDPESVDLVGGVVALAGAEVLVADVHHGGVRLLAVGHAGAPAREVLGTPHVVHGVAVTADGTRAVVTAGGPATAGALVVVDLAAGTAREVADWSAPLRGTRRLRGAAELTASAPDGYPVHGWTVEPDPVRFGPGPHPTVLLIHGGPFAQYTAEVFDEVQVLAEAGYAVVLGNPRGSAGYGAAHGKAIHRALGTVDTDDVLALLDAALVLPAFDESRVGVMGGSYGGYLTAWLTTRTDRFAAAIVERGFLDPVSFVGTSDIGWFFSAGYVGDASTPEGAALVASQSPMAHVGRVVTPTLVIHSEQDLRCPLEQGQRWFVELKRRGVPAELLLFPGEGHELTRSGRPSHRVARFEHVLEWWSRYLPV